MTEPDHESAQKIADQKEHQSASASSHGETYQQANQQGFSNRLEAKSEQGFRTFPIHRQFSASVSHGISALQTLQPHPYAR
jgi:hypothetical protein